MFDKIVEVLAGAVELLREGVKTLNEIKALLVKIQTTLEILKIRIGNGN